jgi:hypothetical protein
MGLSNAAIEVVARNEANGADPFAAVNLNTDGQGVSFGLFQWTQKSGHLGKLLGAMYGYAPGAFVDVFGPKWAELLQATGTAGLRRVGGHNLWEGPWPGRFRAAGQNASLRAAQTAYAASGEHARKAEKAAGRVGHDAAGPAGAVLLDVAVNQGEGALAALVRRIGDAVASLSARAAALALADHAADRYRWDGMELPSNAELAAQGRAQGGVWIEVAPAEWHRFTRDERHDLYERSIKRLRNAAAV